MLGWVAQATHAHALAFRTPRPAARVAVHTPTIRYIRITAAARNSLTYHTPRPITANRHIYSHRAYDGHHIYVTYAARNSLPCILLYLRFAAFFRRFWGWIAVLAAACSLVFIGRCTGGSFTAAARNSLALFSTYLMRFVWGWIAVLRRVWGWIACFSLGAARVVLSLLLPLSPAAD